MALSDFVSFSITWGVLNFGSDHVTLFFTLFLLSLFLRLWE
jgi:hypothetical protein